MKNIRYILVTLLFIVLWSCSDKSTNQISYTAKNNKCKGVLHLNENGGSFYGKYEVYYGVTTKDSGTVSGVIKGDTLRGIFKYISYGGLETSRPIIFLRDGSNLKLGRGSETSYLGIPYYIPETIIFDNKGLYFKPD